MRIGFIKKQIGDPRCLSLSSDSRCPAFAQNVRDGSPLIFGRPYGEKPVRITAGGAISRGEGEELSQQIGGQTADVRGTLATRKYQVTGSVFYFTGCGIWIAPQDAWQN